MRLLEVLLPNYYLPTVGSLVSTRERNSASTSKAAAYKSIVGMLGHWDVSCWEYGT